MNRIFTKPLMLLFFIGLISSISEPIYAQRQKVNHDRFTVTPRKKSKTRPVSFIGKNSDGNYVFQGFRPKYIVLPFVTFSSFTDHFKVYNENFIHKKDYKAGTPKKKFTYSIFNYFAGTSMRALEDIGNKLVINTKNGTYLFYVDQLKKGKGDVYNAAKINIDELTSETPKTIFKISLSKNQKRLDGIDAKVSPDRSKIVFFHRVKSKGKKDKVDKSLQYKFYVVNENLELLYSKLIKFGKDANYTDVIDIMIGNNGDLLISSKINNEDSNDYSGKSEDNEKKKKNKRQKKREAKREAKRGKDGVTLYLVNDTLDAELDFGIEPSKVFFAKFGLDVNNNPVIFGVKVGAFGDKIEKGIFRVSLNQNLEIVSSTGIDEADKETKTKSAEDKDDDGDKKKKKKGKKGKKAKEKEKEEEEEEEEVENGGDYSYGDLKSALLHELITDSKGNSYIIAEDFNYYTRTVTTRSTSPQGFTTVSTKTEHIYNFGNLHIIKYNSKGELEWKQKIYKFSTTVTGGAIPATNFSMNEFSQSSGLKKYKAFLIKDQLQIFYNGDLRNPENEPIFKEYTFKNRKNACTFRVKIDERGNIEKDAVGSRKIKGFSLPLINTGIELEDEIIFVIAQGFTFKKLKYCRISKE